MTTPLGPELAAMFTAVPPESNDLAKNAAIFIEQEPETVRVISGLKVSPEDYARSAFDAAVRAVEPGLAARRDIAGRMLAVILREGRTLPSRAPSYATIERATYTGKAAISGTMYHWAAILDAWHHTPIDGGEERVLSFDEHCARRSEVLQRHPKANADTSVTTLDVFIDYHSYPKISDTSDNMSSPYARLRVGTESMCASIDHRQTKAAESILPVPMTPNRVDELATFIDSLYDEG